MKKQWRETPAVEFINPCRLFLPTLDPSDGNQKDYQFLL
jgi:hypothetical protein